MSRIHHKPGDRIPAHIWFRARDQYEAAYLEHQRRGPRLRVRLVSFAEFLTGWFCIGIAFWAVFAVIRMVWLYGFGALLP
jgi:hypothetical protein